MRGNGMHRKGSMRMTAHRVEQRILGQRSNETKIHVSTRVPLRKLINRKHKFNLSELCRIISLLPVQKYNLVSLALSSQFFTRLLHLPK
jgi:hypothetical protein